MDQSIAYLNFLGGKYIYFKNRRERSVIISSLNGRDYILFLFLFLFLLLLFIIFKISLSILLEINLLGIVTIK